MMLRTGRTVEASPTSSSSSSSSSSSDLRKSPANFFSNDRSEDMEEEDDSPHQDLKEELNYSWCADFMRVQSEYEQPIARMTRSALQARASPTPLAVKKVTRDSGSTPQNSMPSSPADTNHSFTLLFPVDKMDDTVSLSSNHFGDGMEELGELEDALKFEEDMAEGLDLLALEEEIFPNGHPSLQSSQTLTGAPPRLGPMTRGSRY